MGFELDRFGWKQRTIAPTRGTAQEDEKGQTHTNKLARLHDKPHGAGYQRRESNRRADRRASIAEISHPAGESESSSGGRKDYQKGSCGSKERHRLIGAKPKQYADVIDANVAQAQSPGGTQRDEPQ